MKKMIAYAVWAMLELSLVFLCIPVGVYLASRAGEAILNAVADLCGVAL